MMDQLTISSTALDSLSEVVTYIRSRSGFLTSEDWSSGRIFNDLLKSTSGEPIKPAGPKMKELSQLKDTLEHLLRFTKAGIDVVAVQAEKTKSQPQSDVDLTTKLPDELLSHIFELVHEIGAEDYWTPAYVAISVVCRRFRSVALSTPKLWNTLRYVTEYGPYSRAGPRQRQTLLDRNGQTGLLIYIKHDHTGAVHSKDIAAFLNDLIPHSSRWQEFHVSIEKDMDDKESLDAMAIIGTCVSATKLASLKVLNVCFPADGEVLDFTNAGMEQSCAELQHAFKPQILRALQVENFVPNLTGEFWALLTSLDIKLAADDLRDGYFKIAFDIDAFLMMLQTARGLHYLSLTLIEAQFHFPGACKPSSIEFPCLKSFKLTTEHSDYNTLQSLIRCMHVPLLEEYDIIASAYGVTTSRDWLNFVFSEYERYENLKRLFVQVDTAGPYSIGIAIKPIFDHCKGLEHLSLHGNGFLLSIPDVALPPLKSLSFVRCPNVHFRFLDQLVRALRKQGFKLEKLDIVDCDSFPNSYMIPGVRCNWSHWYSTTL